ncbi:Hypothetical protein, putative [Bodo saltans]|uniref:Uncharacterized protein n=1 Tax=Bodo saltans TaxID=75058 RepID=A0A0S4J2T9_BODSA|nr:Hypothetical protein, putative [Bodo saltans]|eukprot:CUG70101.1 Hypothetical protein, putative [Bodo saltans]
MPQASFCLLKLFLKHTTCRKVSKRKKNGRMARTPEVVILGSGSFQIASELLRWTEHVAPQHSLPALFVKNKYFQVDVQLTWDDANASNRHAGDTDDNNNRNRGEERFEASAVIQQHWQRSFLTQSEYPRGVVLVVDQRPQDLNSTLAPLSAPFYLIPSHADLAFRALMLCVDERQLSPHVRDKWVEQCAINGFELMFHAPLMTTRGVTTTTTSSSSSTSCERNNEALFEHIPPKAERRGIITNRAGRANDEELKGSARLLQLIHNTMWITPGSMTIAATTGLTSSSSSPMPQWDGILVIGHSEATAWDLLSHIGSWRVDDDNDTTTKGEENASSGGAATSKKRRRLLQWVHRYGAIQVEATFLPASIFATSMTDLLPQWMPSGIPRAILFVDDATSNSDGGPHRRVSANVAEMVKSFYLRRIQHHQQQQQQNASADDPSEMLSPMFWLLAPLIITSASDKSLNGGDASKKVVKNKNKNHTSLHQQQLLLHAAEYNHIADRVGAEVITLVRRIHQHRKEESDISASSASTPGLLVAIDDPLLQRSFADNGDDGVVMSDNQTPASSSGWRRLCEVVSCACVALSTPIEQNSVLVVPLSYETATSTVAQVVTSLMQQPAAGGAMSCWPLTKSLVNKYYSANVTIYPTGLGWLRQSTAEHNDGSTTTLSSSTSSLDLERFHVVLFITAGRTAVDVQVDMARYASHWAQLVDETTTQLSDDLSCVEANISNDRDRAVAIWLLTTRRNAVNSASDSNAEELLDAMGEPGVEVVVGPAAGNPTSGASSSGESKENDGLVEGFARIQEIIESTRWPISDSAGGHGVTQQQQQPPKDTFDATEESKPPAPSSSFTTAADDEATSSGLVWQGCELPRFMFVDPNTMRTVAVPELFPKPSSHSAPSSSSTYKATKYDLSGDSLLSWMQKLKTDGHRLRRADRQRQALILAEALADEHDGEDVGGDDISGAASR